MPSPAQSAVAGIGQRGIVMPAADALDLCAVHEVFDALDLPAERAAVQRLGAWAARRLSLMREGGHALGCACHLCGDSRTILTKLGANMDTLALPRQPVGHGSNRPR